MWEIRIIREEEILGTGTRGVTIPVFGLYVLNAGRVVGHRDIGVHVHNGCPYQEEERSHII